MAVSDEFKQAWMECQQEFGKDIDAGDIEPLDIGEVDMATTLPAVKFTAPYDPEGVNVFKEYRHVPMYTFKKRIDDLADEVSEATEDLTELETETAAARDGAITARQQAEVATADAEKVNAQIVGMTVTITNRQGVSHSVNIGFEVYRTYPSVAAMKADAANVLEGKFVMIATEDPTSVENARLYGRNGNPPTSTEPFTFLSDLDQASSSAWAEWLNTYKPVIIADHQQAESDHSRAEGDHSTASQDHTTAGTDHSRAETDHTRAEGDHSTASQDHSRAETDHTRAEGDHSTASQDHTTAGTDHDRADTDHQTASQDHSRAETDHSRAEGDHSTASDDHVTATGDHGVYDTDHQRSVTQSGYAKDQGDRAKAFNDHPWEIRQDGYIWVWDETHDNGDGTYGAMVRTNKMIIDFNDLTEAQRQQMIQDFYNSLVFASEQTCEDIITELF